MPKRIQRKRTKGWRMPSNTVYVGRMTKWGNPFRMRSLRVPGHDYVPPNFYRSPEDAVGAFRLALKHGMLSVTTRQIRHELRGKDLCCWCPLDQPCHADVLLEIANEES